MTMESKRGSWASVDKLLLFQCKLRFLFWGVLGCRLSMQGVGFNRCPAFRLGPLSATLCWVQAVADMRNHLGQNPPAIPEFQWKTYYIRKRIMLFQHVRVSVKFARSGARRKAVSCFAQRKTRTVRLHVEICAGFKNNATPLYFFRVHIAWTATR